MVLSNTAVPVEYGKFRDAVLAGDILVGEEVSLQMNIVDFLIESPEFYYDNEAIEGFINFAEAEMTLTDGGDLELLDSFRLWAEDLLAWFYYREEKFYNTETRRMEVRVVKRRLRNKQYLIVGRGAAKSLYASLMQAYFLVIDRSTTHQVVVAPKLKQAEETMSPIRTALARSKGPLFQYMTEGSVFARNQDRVKLASTKKGIENFMTNSMIETRVMSIDALQGLRVKVATVDEWLSGRVKEDVIGALEQGASKIPDYLILATSSEGTDRNGTGDTIKMELLDILRGIYFNPHVSIWYYRLDDVREVAIPEAWEKANPNIGITISYNAYQLDVERMESQPATRNDILAKRFGIPVEGFTYFFTYEQTLPHKYQNFDGLECSMGADLSQGDDFCAFTFVFPLGGERYGVVARSYVSKHRIHKLPKAMQLKYQEMIDEGSLIALEGITLEMDEVYEDLDNFINNHNYQVSTMGYDVYNSDMFVKLWTADYGEYGVEKVRQGAKTESVPMGELSKLAEERKLIFFQELMKFAMGNAIAIQDNNGNLKLDKKRSEEKIDNVAALIDAWVAYKRNKEVFA